MTLLFDTAIVKEGGADPVIESLNITPTAQQQVIEAPSGVDGYSPITVAAAAEPVIESLSVTPTASQQIIEAPSGVDGYSPITVAAAAQPVIQSLSVTPTSSQQIIEAPEGVDGYSPITVAAVPQDNEPEIDFVGWGNTGYIVISNKLLSDTFKENFDNINEGDEVIVTTMNNSIKVEEEPYNDTYRIGFSNPLWFTFDYNNLTQEVHDAIADDGHMSGTTKWVSSNTTTCYLTIDLSYSPMSYYLFDTAQSRWYDLTWSFNISYDRDTETLSISNFQRIN